MGWLDDFLKDREKDRLKVVKPAPKRQAPKPQPKPKLRQWSGGGGGSSRDQGGQDRWRGGDQTSRDIINRTVSRSSGDKQREEKRKDEAAERAKTQDFLEAARKSRSSGILEEAMADRTKPKPEQQKAEEPKAPRSQIRIGRPTGFIDTLKPDDGTKAADRNAEPRRREDSLLRRIVRGITPDDDEDEKVQQRAKPQPTWQEQALTPSRLTPPELLSNKERTKLQQQVDIFKKIQSSTGGLPSQVGPLAGGGPVLTPGEGKAYRAGENALKRLMADDEKRKRYSDQLGGDADAIGADGLADYWDRGEEAIAKLERLDEIPEELRTADDYLSRQDRQLVQAHQKLLKMGQTRESFTRAAAAREEGGKVAPAEKPATAEETINERINRLVEQKLEERGLGEAAPAPAAPEAPATGVTPEAPTAPLPGLENLPAPESLLTPEQMQGVEQSFAQALFQAGPGPQGLQVLDAMRQDYSDLSEIWLSDLDKMLADPNWFQEVVASVPDSKIKTTDDLRVFLRGVK